MSVVQHDVDRSRLGLLAVAGVAVVLAIVVLAPRVGPIGTGTLLALVVAVVATKTALKGDRPTRLK
jgi:hypothetical protein